MILRQTRASAVKHFPGWQAKQRPWIVELPEPSISVCGQKLMPGDMHTLQCRYQLQSTSIARYPPCSKSAAPAGLLEIILIRLIIQCLESSLVRVVLASRVRN